MRISCPFVHAPLKRCGLATQILGDDAAGLELRGYLHTLLAIAAEKVKPGNRVNVQFALHYLVFGTEDGGARRVRLGQPALHPCSYA